jgi:hypothetical protein
MNDKEETGRDQQATADEFGTELASRRGGITGVAVFPSFF